MKYVIDISENRLEVLQMFYKDCQDNLSTSDIVIVEGKPLDDVLDEIKAKIEDESYLSYDDNPRHVIDESWVLEIIDKYRKESDGK